MSLPVGILHNDDYGAIIFWIWLAGTIPVAILAYYLFERHYLCQTCQIRLGHIIDEVKQTEPENFEMALVKRLGLMRNQFRAAHYTRVAFLVDNPEVHDQAELVLKAVIEVKPTAFAFQLYGAFLKLIRQDYTLSMLYFKRASEQPKISIYIQFLIYQAERDRRERLMAMERGNQRMDAVDRVEYKHLMKSATIHHKEYLKQISYFWRALASGKITSKSLLILVTRMETAEKSAGRYYEQLYSRFSYIPRVLENYSNFLDIAAKLEEAEEIRSDLREMRENGEDGDIDLTPSTALESNFKLDTPLKKGRREGSVLTQGSSIPAPPARTLADMRVHRVYRRLVTDHQESSRNSLSRKIFFFVFAVMVVYCTGVTGIHLVANSARTYQGKILRSSQIAAETIQMVDQIRNSVLQNVYLSRNYSSMKQIQDTTYNKTVEITESAQTLFYEENDNNWAGDIFTAKYATILRWIGLEFDVPFLKDTVSLIQLTNEYLTRARDVSIQPQSYWYTPVQLNVTGQNNTYKTITLPATFLIDADFRFISDNNFYLASGYNKPVVNLAKSDRTLAIEAFLQLPKDVVLDCYRKYRVDSNLDGAVNVDDDQSEASSNHEDSDGEEEREKTVIYVSKKTVFTRITIRYITSLVWLALLYSISTLVSFLLMFMIQQIGRRLQRASQVSFYVYMMVSAWRYIAVLDPIIPYTQTLVHQVICDNFVEQVGYYQNALYYGNASLSVTVPPMTTDMRNQFFTRTYLNNLYTLDDITSQFIQDARALCVLPATKITANNHYFIQMDEYSKLIGKGYMEHARYIDQLYATAHERLILANTNLMLPMFIVCVMLVYYRDLRRVLNNIVEENERTLRLTLMLPISMVGEIKSIQKMLHLDQVYDVPELAALKDGSSSLGSATLKGDMKFLPQDLAKSDLQQKLDKIEEHNSNDLPSMTPAETQSAFVSHADLFDCSTTPDEDAESKTPNIFIESNGNKSPELTVRKSLLKLSFGKLNATASKQKDAKAVTISESAAQEIKPEIGKRRLLVSILDTSKNKISPDTRSADISFNNLPSVSQAEEQKES
ncbi:hypothetical protein HK098_004076 [Nowakowskiella sp. JEL0407]|nr:hypothetical protein HK098_004076 [Nowakowskiella sp. JEL0407]